MTDYTHNALNQLVSTSGAGGSATYTYDANGNRATRAKSSQTDTYTYDAENRLISLNKQVADPGQTTGTYQYIYDYRTRRVERNESAASGNVTKVVFSGGLSSFEREGSTNTVEYVRGSDYGGGIGGILYTLRGGNPSYTHYNNRGDVIAKTDDSGSVTYEATYEAFGRRTQENGATSDRQKANTKDEDPTGLLNEGFRYRDLETGAFLTRDPAGFVDGPNLYAYVRQNPWSAFDPAGLNDSMFFAADTWGENKAQKETRQEAEVEALKIIAPVAVGVTATALTSGAAAPYVGPWTLAALSGGVGALSANTTDNLIQGRPVMENADVSFAFGVFGGLGGQALGVGISATARALAPSFRSIAPTVANLADDAVAKPTQFGISTTEYGGTRISVPKTDAYIEGWFNAETKALNIGMVNVPKAMQGQGVGTSLYRGILQQYPETQSVVGRAAFDNAAALEATGDIMQTPRARILQKLGFDTHSVDRYGTMTSSKSQ